MQVYHHIFTFESFIIFWFLCHCEYFSYSSVIVGLDPTIYVERDCRIKCDNDRWDLCCNDGWIDCHTDWILLTQNRGMVKNFVISYSSVIARSEATKQSREGTLVHWIASLRSQWQGATGLLRYARNDREQMDCYDLWRKLLGGDTFIYALFDNKTICGIINKHLTKESLARMLNQSINQ